MAYGYCIGHVTVDDAEAYKEYAAKTPANIAAYSGEFLVRGGACEVMEGEFPGNRTVVIRFPSFAAAKDWYNGAEYSEIRPLRQAVSSGSLMLIEGV